MDKVGRYQFMAEPFHCDFSGRLFMGHLGNHMLNAADFHSNDRGFGMNYLNPRHLTWVLSRLSIEMDEMPEAYDRFAVETWVESAMRFFTNRNFRIASLDDTHTYGYGRSVWAMIDTDTRQPVDLMSINEGKIMEYVDKEKKCPIAPISRVKMNDENELVREIDTYYDDVDMNGHINSVKYIEHVLDLWSVDWYRTHPIRRIDVAYVAEAHGGDRLAFYRQQTPDGGFAVRIVKCCAVDEQSTVAQQTEVARAYISFRSDE